MKRLRFPLLVVGVALVFVIVMMALLAPLLAPYDPLALAGDAFEAPSAQHLLGTNDIGQDVLSRVIWGARSSVIVALSATALSITVGVLIGALAGLFGGLLDMLIMRVVDVFLALPRLPLLVLVAALVGPTRGSVIVVLSLIFWPAAARIVRSQTLTLRARGFITSARGFGGGLLYTVRRHLVPALGPVIIAVFVAVAGNAILLEATLAFLGLADPTGVSWGLMLNRALATPGLYFTPAWTWLVLPAGFAITVAVLGFTFLGVGLEPVLNPRSRRKL